MSALSNLALGLGVAAVLGAATLGVRGCAEGLREQGRVEVREQWLDADKARDARETAAALAREREQRAREQRQTMEFEKNVLAATKREAALRDRLASIVRSHDGLQRELARESAASSERRSAGTCAAADAEADAAQRARGVVAACADRYRAVAADASRLASQVVGLQEHVIVLQPEAAALLEEAR